MGCASSSDLQAVQAQLQKQQEENKQLQNNVTQLNDKTADLETRLAKVEALQRKFTDPMDSAQQKLGQVGGFMQSGFDQIKGRIGA